MSNIWELNLSHTIIVLSAFFFAGITFFSGFGLATVLTPVFILFFPVPIAISLTAVVHFFNNLFKLFLVGRNGNIEVMLKFGLPAMLGAGVGGFTLLTIAKKSFFISYHIFKHTFQVEFVNFVIGILILFFVFLEILPQSSKIAFNKSWLPFGGLLSGFFGGLSGNQGAFRSVFLLKCNLSKEQFIATGILIACMVDVVRLPIYGANFLNKGIAGESQLLFLTVIFAFFGSYVANRFMKKVTINLIRGIIVILLLIISGGLITGLIR